MARRFTLAVSQNFKESIKKDSLTDDVSAALGAATWILPSTLLGLNGWVGMAVAFATTWGVGAAFNIPGLRRAAWALAAVQLAYTHGSQTIQDMTGKPVWRFEENGTVVNAMASSTQTPALNGLAAAMQAGASLQQLPDGTVGVAYPGVGDRYGAGYPTPTLKGFYSADESAAKARTAAPAFSTNMWGN